MEPAPVSIPSNIKYVAIVNRTQASSASQTEDAIHKVLTLQTNDLQKEGALASIRGLSDELMKNNRFSEVKPLTTVELRSFGAGIFPSALPWDTVRKICNENNSDILFSLELFDTDSKISYASNPTNVIAGPINLPAVEHHVNMTTWVKTGWRIYDPKSRIILDEYLLSRDISSTASGINPLVAASALVGRKEAVIQVGNKAGEVYANRILPYWIRVSRDYFVGGDDNFKIAKRKAQAGNWDGAAQIWKEETRNADGKLAGRACYNMAIIDEINGNLDGAIQWAQKSYENYNNHLAIDYLRILRYRKQQNEVLKSQTVAFVNQ